MISPKYRQLKLFSLPINFCVHYQISLGIAQSPDEHFKIATGRGSRKDFLYTALNFTLAHGFDGLELTWSFDK